jgi:predicted GNAT family acetyltransferase
MLKVETKLSIINNPKMGYIHLFEDGIQVAEVNYRILDTNLLCIDHTYVYPDFRNEGYGHLLVSELNGIARQEDIRIYPICPFAKFILEQKKYHVKIKKAGSNGNRL